MNMTNQISANLSRALDQNNISGYLKQIRKYPLLSHEEEENLANKWIKNNCFEAAHKLIKFTFKTCSKNFYEI